MHRIDSSGAATSLPTPAAVGTPGYWTDGDAASGTPATVIDPDWLNSIQEELVAIVLASGLSLSKTDRAQVLAALRKILGFSNMAVFTTSQTWTVPGGITRVRSRIWGGGGGGGGTQGANSGSSGGSAGGYAEGFVQVTPGANIFVTVGTGGAGGNNAAGDGAAGGSSSFGAFFGATGGAGGKGASAGYQSAPGGTPGYGYSATLTLSGSQGGIPYSITNGGGTAQAVAGTGGSVFGSLTQSVSVGNAAINGFEGRFPGGGGNGGIWGGSGGAGANGFVIVEW